MQIKFKCGCGEYNYTFGDWISHWKYGIQSKTQFQRKLRAIRHFLMTRIELRK